MKHELKTLADILKVITPENLEVFLVDFRMWLTLSMIVDSVNSIEGIEAEKKEPDIMNWIDDGKNDAHIRITVANK
jgi:hypothetical protein